ncbi:arabinosyltransferase domain-containing protein [Gordonia sp. ABSL1-1]|uniref:arabinosyltransferase domain-containing protein n=1 Tax=Gordonia sp. ABSL1-1 TaxID=3053923 RepID=UPI0025729E37|nr:arabinosyltransferase domain-containing protein [Gordonia sp. ABSL1-1]MDL9937656.1 arabinosyltransferase domain-containing protein [Gordonia sp. ABSL1-1]
MTSPATEPASDETVDPRTEPSVASTRPWALAAVVAAAVAILSAILTPLLPVTVQTATIDWPQAGNTSVTASLVTQTAADLDITVGCPTLRAAAAGATDKPVVVVATMPSAGQRAADKALFVTAGADATTVNVRGKELLRIPTKTLASCTSLHVWASPTALGAKAIGTPLAGTDDPANNPQVSGVFTALEPAAVARAVDGGLAVRIDVDNRFESSPSVLKLLVMILGVIAAIVTFVAIAVLDVRRGYHRRVGNIDLRRLFAPRVADIAVTAVLVIWHFLGAGSSDDGYILAMGRNSQDAGYLSNYYRFHGIPEAPFDWYYSFLAHWSDISTSGLWMRLPALVAGLVSWFILSRILLPRLGGAVRRSQWAMLTAAAVFVAFWMPLCSGLRSEAIIVLGSLLTWWGVEQAVATRRMLPAASAALAAGLTLAVAPHGLIAVALLIAGSRPMLRTLRRRRAEDGLLPLLAPIAAAAAVVIIVVFRDQTLATVAEAVRIRYTVGPTLVWYQELLRFYFLSLTTQDGSLVRRVPLLLFFAAVFVTLAVMLRRKHIRGVDPGPVWRLIGASLLTVLLLSFTPTKWTVQFGIYAGLAAAMAAVATVAVAESARRSPRNLSMYVAVLMFACAVATAGKNAWGWAYDFGIAWFDKAPELAGIPLSSVFLVLAVVGLAVAVWFHLRIDVDAERGVVRDGPAPSSRLQTAVASSPMAIIAVLVVLAELALFTKAAATRTDTYTTFSANIRALTGDTCGMAQDVLVERDPNRGMLTPVGTTDISAALAGKSTGFTPDGVAPDLMPDPTSLGAGTINTSGNLARPFVVAGGPPGTTGGVGPTGVNGSTAALPFGLDPDTTPVLGSFGHDNESAELTSGWYRLPARDASSLLVVTAAGPIFSVDADGAPTPGRSLRIQFGRPGGPDGFTATGPGVAPIDPGPVRPNRPWRNLRIPMSAVPAGATAMRIVASDTNVSPDQWLAFTPPRAPQLDTLQDVVGSSDPVLLDLSVGSQFPCQRPMTTRHGIVEVPMWRIVPDQTTTNSKSKTWQASINGGLLTTSEALTTPTTMATYLRNDWYRDWGGLQRLSPLVPDAIPARVTTGEKTTSGLARPGAIRVVPQDD